MLLHFPKHHMPQLLLLRRQERIVTNLIALQSLNATRLKVDVFPEGGREAYGVSKFTVEQLQGEDQ